jgi:hypothetical protein
MPRVEEVPLDFTNLAGIDDGRINRLLAMHLARVAQDCIDRPGDKTKRQVCLTFTVEPVVADDGQAETSRIEIECKSKVPVYRSRPYEMRLTKGGFKFNRDFPDAIDQPSLYPCDDEDDE